MGDASLKIKNLGFSYENKYMEWFDKLVKQWPFETLMSQNSYKKERSSAQRSTNTIKYEKQI